MRGYQLALTSVNFDNSYTNVLRFDDRIKQREYFGVDTLFSIKTPDDDVNLNVGTLNKTTFVYDCGKNESINELLSKNYCIVKDNTPNKTLDYYYYFILDAKQECDNRISLLVELDVYQTYYIDLQFDDCLINKAHLNRFVDIGDGKVAFDGRVESKLFEQEDIKDVAKRMTHRKRIKIYDTNFADIDEWLDANIECWCYCFVSPTDTIKAQAKDYSSTNVYLNMYKQVDYSNNMAILCFPIYRLSNYIQLYSDNSENIIWGNEAYGSVDASVLFNFARINNGFGKIYSIKYSMQPPFQKLPNDINYSFVSGRLKVFADYSVNAQRYKNPFIDGVSITGSTYLFPAEERLGGQKYAMAVVKTIPVFENFIYEIQNFENEFEKNDIINSNMNEKFNPKLNSLNYKELKLSDETCNGYSYDMQKLNSKTLTIRYTEAVVPDIEKKYIRVVPEDDGVYIKECASNLTGFINSNDTSICLPTSAYQSMLANNKNFFLQNSINRDIAVATGVKNIATGIVGGALVGGLPGAIVGGAGQLLQTGMNYAKDKINENLSIDNLKNAPGNVAGAKGNVVFNMAISRIGIYIEEWDILPNEKKIVNEYMNLYGFTYNRIDNIKNVDNIRKYYNYISADIQGARGINISSAVHDKFKEIFKKGVRMWNTDNFTFEKENYEKWLEE